MTDFDPTNLSPAGEERRTQILQHALQVSQRRRQRQRRVRAIGLAGLLVALTLGVHFATRDASQAPVAGQPRRVSPGPASVPPPTPSPDQDLSTSHANSTAAVATNASTPMLQIESLTDEMLLTQLNEARVPYLRRGDGRVELISSGFDPWLIELDPPTEDDGLVN